MSQVKRYQKLGYSDSIPKIHRYPLVCKELSFILRNGYSKSPKNLQNLILQDVLAAFRLLPGSQTSNAVSSARLLYQSAEASLPKQKKNLAVTEFKQAMIALKRRSKTHQEEKVSGSVELPQDVLLHIFGFLDFQSLVFAGLVCRSWNSAATNDRLWRVQYDIFFRNADSPFKRSTREDSDHSSSEEESDYGTSSDWKEAFKRTYRGGSMKNQASGRGYCENCRAIVWLENTKCSSKDCRMRQENRQIKPVSLSQVFDYVLDDSLKKICYSDSESDSEEDYLAIMAAWAAWAGAVSGERDADGRVQGNDEVTP